MLVVTLCSIGGEHGHHFKEVVSVIRSRINGQAPDVQIRAEPETRPKKLEDNEEPNG